MGDVTYLRIVVVDDDPADVELVELTLERAGLAAKVERVDNAVSLRAALKTATPLVLCDYTMPGFSAEAALAIVGDRVDPPALVVVTRAIGESAVVELFRAGAKDYVPKDKLRLLPAVIERVLRERAREQARREAERALASANARMRLLSARLVDAQELERCAVARELHDSLGQQLTGIAIHVQAAMDTNPAAMQQALERVLMLSRQAIDEVKSMSFMLRPAPLEVLGLSAAAQAILQQQLVGSGLQGTLRRRGTPPVRPTPAHAVAMRVLQEALTNAVRHSRASSILVRLHYLESGMLCMAVADDGIGFDPQATLAGGLSPRNLGLHGMIERVELFGGRLRFRSRPSRGSVLRLVLGP